MDRVLTSLIAISNFMRYSHRRPAVFGGIAALSLLLVPALTMFPHQEPRSLASSSSSSEAAQALSEQQANSSTTKSGVQSDGSKPAANSKKDDDKKDGSDSSSSAGASPASPKTGSSSAANSSTGDNSQACPECDKKSEQIPAGELVLSSYEFTLPQGQTLRDAFTAKAGSGKPIGIVSSSLTSSPDPVSPVQTTNDAATTHDISKSYESWTMGLQSYGAAGDYNLKIQASDGEMIYYATIKVHVLPS